MCVIFTLLEAIMIGKGTKEIISDMDSDETRKRPT
jgi:hypothetical protein